MDNLFNEIDKIRHGFTGTPLSDKDIEEYQEELVECGFGKLPNEVIEFLKKHNGFLLENRCVWGINTKEHYRYDILGENAIAQNPKPEKLILLGATETTFIAWQKETNNYAILDRYDLDKIYELDNFPDAVRYILKIDD